MQIIDIIETEKAEISLLERQIIRLRFKPNVEFKLKDALEVDEAFKVFSGGIPYKSLVDGRDIFGHITKEAKQHFADNSPLRDLRMAEALVVNHLANRLIAKVYTMVHKPNNPVEVFTDFGQAMAWLKTF